MTFDADELTVMGDETSGESYLQFRGIGERVTIRLTCEQVVELRAKLERVELDDGRRASRETLVKRVFG